MTTASMGSRAPLRIEPRRIDPYDPFLLVLAVLTGLTAVLVLTPLGSGDYGQWLMTARPYAGLSLPDYRAAGAVPPVVPVLLGGLLASGEVTEPKEIHFLTERFKELKAAGKSSPPPGNQRSQP